MGFEKQKSASLFWTAEMIASEEDPISIVANLGVQRKLSVMMIDTWL